MKDALLPLLAVLTLAGGYFLQQAGLLQPEQVKQQISADCDLQQQSCQVELPDGSQLNLAISPRPFRAVMPLDINLLFNGTRLPDELKIQFEGLNMDMGYNLVTLQKTSANNFQAKAMLPACTLDKMIWAFHLYVTVGETTTDVIFNVET